MKPDQWWGGDSEDPGLEPEESFGVVLPFPITHLPAEDEVVRPPGPSAYSTIVASPCEALVV